MYTHSRPYGLRSRRPAERGTILLLTLVMSSLLALLSSTFNSSVRNQMDLSRDYAGGLRAELAAHSGLVYGRRMLAMDASWTGTGELGLDLPGIGTFIIERLDEVENPDVKHTATLEVEGQHENQAFRIEAQVDVEPGDLARTKALVHLGGKLKMHNCDYNGDLIVADKLGVVYDFFPSLNGGAGGWLPADISSVDTVQFTSTALNGILYKYTSSVHVDSQKEQITDRELYMPSWNLESYLTPDSDRIIYTGVTSLKNVTLEQTAVFVLDPGDTLTLEDVTLRGGMVVHVDPSYDLRSGYRNKVVFKKHNVVGGGLLGIHPHLGLLAPGCRIKDQGSMGTDVTGVLFCADLYKLNHLTVTGQTIVVNKIDNNNNCEYTYVEGVTLDPPPGVGYAGPPPFVDVASVIESYDPYKPPDGFGYKW